MVYYTDSDLVINSMLMPTILWRTIILIVTRIVIGNDGTLAARPNCDYNMPTIIIADYVISIIVTLMCAVKNWGYEVVLFAYIVVECVFLYMCCQILDHKKDNCYVRSAIAELVAVLSPLISGALIGMGCVIFAMVETVREKLKENDTPKKPEIDIEKGKMSETTRLYLIKKEKFELDKILERNMAKNHRELFVSHI